MEFRVSPHQRAVFGQVPERLPPRTGDPLAECTAIAASGFPRGKLFNTGLSEGVHKTLSPGFMSFDGRLEVESNKFLFILVYFQFDVGLASRL